MIDCKYFQIAESRFEEWEQCYHPLNVARELTHMILWLDSNPRKRKKNYRRFVINWLNRNYAKIASDQVNARLAAQAGAQRAPRELSSEEREEMQEIRRRYPDLS